MCLNPIRTKNDKCDDEVENVFQTYREVIDKMGKVSLGHIKEDPKKIPIFQDGKINKNMKK